MTMQPMESPYGGVKREPSGVALIRELPDMLEILKQFQATRTLMTDLVHSLFIPQAYRVDVSRNASPEERKAAEETAIANGTAAAMMGRSVGLDPFQSLQNIHVIHGRPGMSARIKVALSQSAGHEIWTEIFTADLVRVVGHRKGASQNVVIELTMADAKTAGWTSNPNYFKTPADMLYARAAGRVADRVAGDVLFGIATLEDLYDIEADPAPAVQVTASDLRDRAGIPQRTAPENPPQEATTAPQTEQKPTGDVRTDQQSRHLFAALGALGIKGTGSRADGLKLCSEILERPVDSTKTLTMIEAEQITTFLLDLAKKDEAERHQALAFMLADDALPVDEPNA